MERHPGRNCSDEASRGEEGRRIEHQREGEVDGRQKRWKPGRKCRLWVSDIGAFAWSLWHRAAASSPRQRDTGKTNGSWISSVDTRAKFNCQSDNEKIVKVAHGKREDYSLHCSLLWQVRQHLVRLGLNSPKSLTVHFNHWMTAFADGPSNSKCSLTWQHLQWRLFWMVESFYCVSSGWWVATDDSVRQLSDLRDGSAGKLSMLCDKAVDYWCHWPFCQIVFI